MELLLLEDDVMIGEGLKYSLEEEGFVVTLCPTVASAKICVEETDFGLALLDLSLPDGTGYEICKLIKEKGHTPVIFLTAHDDEANVVMGLDMGADDYVYKPFRIRELLSRINSVLRRYTQDSSYKKQFEYKHIKVNLASAKVYKDQDEVLLTALEYRLLLEFINHQNQILTRNQLLESIWDIAGDFVNDNTLTVYIKRLREKIEKDIQNPEIIKTIRGQGYRLGE